MPCQERGMTNTLCRVLAIVFFGLVAYASSPSPALACSPIRSCRRLLGARPIDGATEVPRNIEFRVSYVKPLNYDAQTAWPVLETDDGEIVPTAWESASDASQQLLVGRATTVLAASTHYRLRHPFRLCSQSDAGPSSPSCPDGLCAAEHGDVISEFTTSNLTKESVLAAPVFSGEVSRRVDVCDRSSCCGPYQRCLLSVELPALAPGQMYRVTRGGALQAYSGSPEFPTTLVATVGSAFNWNAQLLSEGEYEVVVVDEAGNRGPAASFSVPACILPPDAGVPPVVLPTPDAATSDPVIAPRSDGGTASAREEGCSLGGAHPSGASMAWLALAFVRRRRAIKA
jgi:hypothetical protein